MILEVHELAHRYGDTAALQGLSFGVKAGEIFGLLGPNGGGKTTLFRILSTLLKPDAGRASIRGHCVVSESEAVRRQIGVVFQSPSLDLQLTVRENMRHQGHLYGIRGADLETRIDEMLDQVGVRDREGELVRNLSGGLQRRIDLAKGLMHRPSLVLLDEPTTGLDPGARLDLWSYLERARSEQGLSVLITTHLMEDADRCDRLLFLDRGQAAALDSPEALRQSLGGDVVTIRAGDLDNLASELSTKFGQSSEKVDDTLRVRRAGGPEFVPQLFEAFPGQIDAVSVGRPTLEDVFMQKTGHRLWDRDGD
ncbi:MAG: ATP-binding cassette domain-containing protein [Candidatus Binatia bacterium]|nr:ATP-binding cassette domain-containing protein [Candidatus Binatia bacterium]MDG2009158.1 ATP-binding cassette domain-containing protein [Candidatus Binatia bacterium]